MDRKALPEAITYESVVDYFVEYVCDIAAVRLVGPAFLFALLEFHTSRQSPSVPVVGHPPLLLRLKNIIDTLSVYEQRFGQLAKRSPVAKQVEDTIEALAPFTNSMELSPSEAVAIFNAVEPSLITARTAVNEVVPVELRFQPSVELVTKYIPWVQQGIPPSAWQAGRDLRVLSFAEIMNAVWAYRVAESAGRLSLRCPWRSVP